MYAAIAPLLLSLFLFPELTAAACNDTVITDCSFSYNVTSAADACETLTSLETCYTDACDGTLDTGTQAMLDTAKTDAGECGNGASFLSVTTPVMLVTALLLLLLHFPG